MPEIYIAYDLPSFKGTFGWMGTEADAARILQSQRELAATNDVTFSNMVNSAVVQAPRLLADTNAVRGPGIRAMLTAWALQLDTTNPKHPGTIIDYIAVHDFWVTVTRAAPGNIETTIDVQPRSDQGLA